MKKFALLLFLLLAIESWGVYGAWRTKGVRFSCAMQIGPLCYLWEETALGKILGDDKSAELEDAIDDAKKTWEEDFVDKIKSKGKNGISDVLDEAKKIATDGIDDAKKAVDEKVK